MSSEASRRRRAVKLVNTGWCGKESNPTIAFVASLREREGDAISQVHSQHTNTHRPNSKREGQHLAHVTAASFSCSRPATCTALTDTPVQSRHTPGLRVNPGSEPVQPPRQAGVWTVADTQTQHILSRRLAGE